MVVVLTVHVCMYLSHAEVLGESLQVNLLLSIAFLHLIHNRFLLHKLRLDTTRPVLRLRNLKKKEE